MKVEKTGINNAVTAPLRFLLNSEFILIHCLVRLAALKNKTSQTVTLESYTNFPSLQSLTKKHYLYNAAGLLSTI